MKYTKVKGILTLPERNENDKNTGWMLCIKYEDFKLFGYKVDLMWRERKGVKEPAPQKSVEILNLKTDCPHKFFLH
jgi:hypothetical protein